jgi:hypothetical protein
VQSFALLVLNNAYVDGMVGIERTVVPLIGSEEFKVASTTLVAGSPRRARPSGHARTGMCGLA